MHNTSKKKILIFWATIVIAIALFPNLTSISEQVPMSTIVPTPIFPPPYSHIEQFKVSVLSLSAVLSALTLIVITVGKIFKPIREGFVRWIRKSLRIVDSNKTIDERFANAEKQVAIESLTRQQEYTVMTKQNDSIEGTLSEVLKSVGEIIKKMEILEDSNVALIRDGITKTFYVYCHQAAIPIHEKENMGKMYDIYKKYNANSYVESVMRTVDDWEVLFGNDTPSCNTKL